MGIGIGKAPRWHGSKGEQGDEFRKTLSFAEKNDSRLVPLLSGKAPKQKGWWDKAAIAGAVTKRAFKGVNVGIANGYGNIVDTDFDDALPASRRLANRMFAEPTASFGRGEDITHRMYQVDNSTKSCKFQSANYGMIVEVRGRRTQTMAPGSIHPESGELIKWVDVSRPAELSSTELINMAQRYAAGCVLTRHWNHGQRHDLTAALVGSLVRHTNWSNKKINRYVRQIRLAVGDTEKRENAEYERARINDDEPAYGKKNLKTLLGDDYDDVEKWLFNGALDDDEADNTVFASIGATAADYVKRDIPVEEPAIHGFFSSRKIALFHGRSGAGKSFIVSFIVNALGNGRSIADWKVEKPRRVLYIEAEMDETEFHGRAKSILAENRNVIIVRPEDWELAFDEPGPFIDRIEDQRRLEKIIEAQRIDTLAIEPLSWVLSVADELSNDDTKLWAPWFRKLKNNGITVITAHNEGWTQKRVRGASRIVDSVDLTFSVVENSRGRFTITRGKSRTSNPMNPKVVTVNVELADSQRLSLVRSHDKASRQLALLVAWALDPSISLRELAERFGVDEKTISRDAKELEEVGFVERSGRSRIVTAKGKAKIKNEEVPE